MLDKSRMLPLIEMLRSRGALFYHACQLRDLESYLKLSGVPSRYAMECAKAPFTSFETDENDRSNGVWDKVFVNLDDFGGAFACGGAATPNAYGPILLRISPSRALRDAEDVAVCLRSAGGRAFDRQREALTSVEDIDWLYEPQTGNGFPRLKRRDTLRERYPDAQTPEVSLTFRSGVLPLSAVTSILVDPYLGDVRLLERVSQLARPCLYGKKVEQRSWGVQDTRRNLYDEFPLLLSAGVPSLPAVYRSSSGSDELKRWANELLCLDLEWQFRRFAKYLRAGTLAHLGLVERPS